MWVKQAARLIYYTCSLCTACGVIVRGVFMFTPLRTAASVDRLLSSPAKSLIKSQVRPQAA